MSETIVAFSQIQWRGKERVGRGRKESELGV
jgi:hypothetical protein